MFFWKSGPENLFSLPLKSMAMFSSILMVHIRDNFLFQMVQEVTTGIATGHLILANREELFASLKIEGNLGNKGPEKFWIGQLNFDT